MSMSRSNVKTRKEEVYINFQKLLYAKSWERDCSLPEHELKIQWIYFMQSIKQIFNHCFPFKKVNKKARMKYKTLKS